MGKVFKGLFLGALIGVGVTLALYVLSFVLDILALSCDLISCVMNCEVRDLNCNHVIGVMWEGGAFWTLLIICTIGGTVIGTIVGAVEAGKIKSEEIASDRSSNFKNMSSQSDSLISEISNLITTENNALNHVSMYARQERNSAEETISKAQNKIEFVRQKAILRHSE